MSERLVLADLLEQLVILSVGLRRLVKGQKDRTLERAENSDGDGGNEAGGSVPTWLGWDFFRSTFASQSLGLAVGVGGSCSAGFDLANKRDPCAFMFRPRRPEDGMGEASAADSSGGKKTNPDMNAWAYC